jgi:hypothetical protein
MKDLNGHCKACTWIVISLIICVQVGNQLKRLVDVLRKAAGQPKAGIVKHKHEGPELAVSAAQDEVAQQQKRKAASSNDGKSHKAKGTKKKQKA